MHVWRTWRKEGEGCLEMELGMVVCHYVGAGIHTPGSLQEQPVF